MHPPELTLRVPRAASRRCSRDRCSTNISSASVTVQAPVAALAISPASASVSTGGSQTFSANGGKVPYTFSIVTNNSGATINSSTGAYVAGSKGSVTDTVRVADSSANTSSASVAVKAPVATLAISPASASVSTGGSQTFSASGGTVPTPSAS